MLDPPLSARSPVHVDRAALERCVTRVAVDAAAAPTVGRRADEQTVVGDCDRGSERRVRVDHGCLEVSWTPERCPVLIAMIDEDGAAARRAVVEPVPGVTACLAGRTDCEPGAGKRHACAEQILRVRVRRPDLLGERTRLRSIIDVHGTGVGNLGLGGSRL